MLKETVVVWTQISCCVRCTQHQYYYFCSRHVWLTLSFTIRTFSCNENLSHVIAILMYTSILFLFHLFTLGSQVIIYSTFLSHSFAFANFPISVGCHFWKTFPSSLKMRKMTFLVEVEKTSATRHSTLIMSSSSNTPHLHPRRSPHPHLS